MTGKITGNGSVKMFEGANWNRKGARGTTTFGLDLASGSTDQKSAEVIDRDYVKLVSNLANNPIQTFWVGASRGHIPKGAEPGGHPPVPMYVARAGHGGGLYPGKVRTAFGATHIAYSGAEASNGAVPDNAVAAGRSNDRRPLYAARAWHAGGLHIGFVTPGQPAQIPCGWAVHPAADYEVLINAGS